MSINRYFNMPILYQGIKKQHSERYENLWGLLLFMFNM